MESLRRKIGLQFLVSNGSVAAHFVLSLVLARLLSPTEVGIFSITAVLIGFTHVFRDFGVVSFIKRQRTVTPQILGAASGVLYTSSWSIAALLYFSSGFWSRFFQQPGIEEIMPILALGFVFIPFGSIPQAVLSRELDVKKTTLVTALATAVYIFTCVSLAALNFSYMSMAWANLASIVVSGGILSLMMPRDLRTLPSWRGWNRVVQFGVGAMLTSSLKALDTAVPDVMLGKLSDAHHVGIYSRANSTVNILNTVTSPTINYFALPYLARVHHSGNKINQEILRTISYLTAMMWPALALTSQLAPQLIAFLYGESWADSAVIVPWLCLAAAMQVIFAIVPPSLLAIGRPYLCAIPMAVGLVLKVSLALLFFDGRFDSFAKIVAISECLSLPVYILIARKHLHVGFRQVGMATAKSGVIAALLLVLLRTQFAVLAVDSVSPIVSLLIAAMWVLPMWLLLINLLKHPICIEVNRILKLSPNDVPLVNPEKVRTPSGPTGTVIVYGAVAVVPAPLSYLGKVRANLRAYVQLKRDTYAWRRGSTSTLDYRNYQSSETYNLGDAAIADGARIALKRQFFNTPLLSLNWGDSRFAPALSETYENGIIVVAGSGYIIVDKFGRLSPRIAADVRIMKAARVPVILFGIGVNRLLSNHEGREDLQLQTEDENTLRELLNTVVAISVRDKASKELLSRYTSKSVEITGDPALYLSGAAAIAAQPVNAASNNVTIGVNFPHHGPDASKRVRADIAAYIEMLRKVQDKSKCKFKYMMHYEAEIVIARMLQHSGIDLEICSGSVSELVAGYQSLNIHIGGMLHSCILAASAGTPPIGVAYDIKHAGFFEQLGLSEYCLPAVPFDTEMFVATALRALENEQQLRATILTARTTLRQVSDDFLRRCHSLVTTPAKP